MEKIKSAYKIAKKNKQIGKYGITGNTGLGIGGLFHVSMPYDSNGKVFIVQKLEEKLSDGRIGHYESWKRVDKDKVGNNEIIKCSFCNEPAVRLDHLWPYYNEMNACEKHLDEFKKYSYNKEFMEKNK